MSLQKYINAHSMPWLALFSTSATLLCCALPILLVSLGMGASVASLVSNMPWLITLSEHKIWLFSVSALLLLFSFISLFRPNRSCPSDAKLGHLCQKSQVWNRRILWLSLIIWGIGFFAAFLALPLQIWFDHLFIGVSA